MNSGDQGSPGSGLLEAATAEIETHLAVPINEAMHIFGSVVALDLIPFVPSVVFVHLCGFASHNNDCAIFVDFDPRYINASRHCTF